MFMYFKFIQNKLKNKKTKFTINKSTFFSNI